MALPAPENSETAASSKRKQIAFIAGGVIFVFIILISVVLASVVMLRDPARTETVRDIVIIFLAAESVVFGLVLVILMVQVARLTALIENELRPILESTNETLGTLRGTTQFLSRNVVSPVIRVNSSVAALRRALGVFRVRRTR
ncbi:MAG: hypothetical protein ACE5M4_01605 [Anaerolineales bacterium]